MYKAREYAIFRPNDSPVYYDPLELQFVEMSNDYIEVLRDFRQPVPSINKEDLSYTDEKMEILAELIEFGAIEESKTEAGNDCFRPFVPHVTAFRIVMTEQCNLQCQECFVTKNKDHLPTMGMSTLDLVIDKIIEFSHTESLQIHFFGGEPLLRYKQILHTVDRLKREAKKEPQYSITTNATLVDDDMARFLASNHFSVAVSIDGNESLHNLLRPDKANGGSYKATKDGYDKLVKAGARPSIIITPHPDYINELADGLELIIEDFAPKTITINEPFQYNTLKWSIDGKIYADFLIDTLIKCRQRGIKLSSALTPILAALSQGIRRESPCSMACRDIMASIRTDGKISFCSQKWLDQMAKDVNTYDEPLDVPHHPAPQCGHCIARTVCGGPCPAFQILSHENIDVNKCVFMQNILEKITEHLDLFEEPE